MLWDAIFKYNNYNNRVLDITIIPEIVCMETYVYQKISLNLNVCCPPEGTLYFPDVFSPFLSSTRLPKTSVFYYLL